MNKASIIGVLAGVAAILFGSILEGGRISSVIQGPAALIVFGGTFGATFLSFSLKDILLSGEMLKGVFLNQTALPDGQEIIADMIKFANKARQQGIVALDNDIRYVRYGFFRRALRLVIDGIDPHVIYSALEQENRTFEQERGRAARVFEAAGGYAPTIGIIGAVLGLIHVMENLSDPTKLGSGIAVAFVATVYGVAAANLLLLPIARKMSNNMREELFLREMIIEGVMGIQAGRSPYYIREHLSSYLPGNK